MMNPVRIPIDNVIGTVTIGWDIPTQGRGGHLVKRISAPALAAACERLAGARGRRDRRGAIDDQGLPEDGRPA